MIKKYLQKIGVYLLVLLGLSILIFIIGRVLPGDPARQALGPHASAETVQKLRQEMNLDKALPLQYVLWLKGALQGDLGKSLLTRRSVLEDVQTYLPATFEIVILSASLMVIFGILLGIVAAIQRKMGRWSDPRAFVLGDCFPSLRLGYFVYAFIWLPLAHLTHDWPD